MEHLKVASRSSAQVVSHWLQEYWRYSEVRAWNSQEVLLNCHSLYIT